MRQALDEFVIHGVKSTIPLFKEIFASQAFVESNYTTRFIEEFFAEKAKNSTQK